MVSQDIFINLINEVNNDYAKKSEIQLTHIIHLDRINITLETKHLGEDSDTCKISLVEQIDQV